MNDSTQQATQDTDTVLLFAKDNPQSPANHAGQNSTIAPTENDEEAWVHRIDTSKDEANTIAS